MEGLEPALRIRHAITNTNYYVQVFSARRGAPASSGSRASTGKRSGAAAHALRGAIPAAAHDLHWTRTTQPGQPSAYRAYAQDSAASKGYEEHSRRASRMTGRGQGIVLEGQSAEDLSMRCSSSRRMESEPEMKLRCKLRCGSLRSGWP